jgi:energy-converting hydrogenase Eha subunit A
MVHVVLVVSVLVLMVGNMAQTVLYVHALLVQLGQTKRMRPIRLTQTRNAAVPAFVIEVLVCVNALKVTLVWLVAGLLVLMIAQERAYV